VPRGEHNSSQNEATNRLKKKEKSSKPDGKQGRKNKYLHWRGHLVQVRPT